MQKSNALTESEVDERFLRLCLQSQWDSQALKEASGMAGAGDVNWSAVLLHAKVQRLSPLLYHILHNEHFIPPPFIQSLREVYDYTARYNLFLSGELQHVLRRLTEEGVRVIVLKGAALAQAIYRNPALRPQRDLDLLVPREAVPVVLSTLNDLGYTAPIVETQPGAALAYESQMLLVKRKPVLSQIEIHWSLIDSPYYQENLATDWFWQTALPLQVGNVSTLMLGPEAQTLYLCAHLLLHHGGNDLLWLNDVGNVIRLYDKQLDWDELLVRAQAAAFCVPAQRILPVVAQDWGAPIPANVLERLRELHVPPAEVRVSRWLAARDRPPAQRFWSDLLSLQDPRKQLAFAVGNLFPSRAYMQQRYHISNPLQLILSYPYRWWLGIHHAIVNRSSNK